MAVLRFVLLLLCACVQRSEPNAQPGAAGQPPATAVPLPDAGATPPKLPDAGATLPPPLDAGRVQQAIDAGALDAGHAAQTSGSRAVLVGQLENARDLGSIALEGGRRVKSHKLFRGPPLANLSAKDCSEVAKLGLRSVIDLRIESEVVLQPDQACALEEAHAQLVAAPLPVPYNVSATDYIAVLDARESLAKVFEVLGDEARYPVYFHCTWGRDRTGILAAVILLALGATEDAIMEDYLESRRTVGAYPASLEAALDEIKKRGGIETYLTSVGVTAHQLEVLRASAVESAR